MMAMRSKAITLIVEQKNAQHTERHETHKFFFFATVWL